MKILYISPEHVSGTLSLFQEEHRRRGDECRFVTFWHSRWDFPDDICLNLPLMPNRAWVRALRTVKVLRHPNMSGSLDTDLPFWSPGRFENALFTLRDQLLWPKMKRLIDELGLLDFDIVHFDGGLDFTRNGQFASEMHRRRKKIVCYYHGSDMRNRGIMRPVDRVAALRLTCEWDLLESDSRLKYLYLPFDTQQYPSRPYRFHDPIRVCHASRNPYKGTPYIEAAVRRIAEKYPIEFVHLQNIPHQRALKIKSECDIFIDQLTNSGGWGYGMSSVEALSMGMPIITNIPDKMRRHLDDHPFVHADTDSFEESLEHLLQNENGCAQLAARGREWVRKMHDIRSVGDQLYAYYGEMGWV